MKGLLPLFLAFVPTLTNWYYIDYSDDVVVENNSVTKVNQGEFEEVRIYRKSGATSISDGAFDGCTFKSIMISDAIREINDEFPNSLVTILYTGALEDINFNIPAGISVECYARDEGFLNYWVSYIRPNLNDSICNVTKEHYLTMKNLYFNLGFIDASKVLEVEDGSATIAESISFLDEYFNQINKSQSRTKEISQSVMITLILIIAAFGMTSIGLFYVLKDKKVIS